MKGEMKRIRVSFNSNFNVETDNSQVLSLSLLILTGIFRS